MPTLYEGARRLVTVCGRVKADERALIITDDNKYEIAQNVRNVILDEIKGDVTLAVIGGQKAGGQEPPAPVAAAMKAADIIYMITSHSLSQTLARTEAQKAGARVLSIPDPQISDITSRMIEADFEALSPYIHKVAESLSDAREIRFTAPGGTDMTFSAVGMKGRGLDLLAHNPGEFRSMSVEANVGPAFGTANGVVVFDASIPIVGPLDEPVRVRIEKGFAVEIEGGEKAKQFARLLMDFDDPYVYNIGEFGIGLNPCARPTGNSYVEDESAIGTCHIGFGTNLSQGGNIKAACHIDAIVLSPTVEADGRLIMKEGELVEVPIKPLV